MTRISQPRRPAAQAVTSSRAQTLSKSKAAAQASTPPAAGWKPGAGGQAKANRQAFARSPYTNADAKVAQQKFGLPSLDKAKEFIGRAILAKNERLLEQNGVSRALYDNQDCLTAFKRSGYTDADAKEAMRQFDFLRGGTLQNAKEYLGLKIRNKYESMLSDVGITRLPYDDHEMIPLAKRKGYTEGDAKKAILAFDFLKGSSVREAMGYLGLKVANDYESMLRDAGIKPSGRAAAE